MSAQTDSDHVSHLLYLEDRENKEALAFVDQSNAFCDKYFNSLPNYQTDIDNFTKILNSEHSLPDIDVHDGHVYNLKQSDNNPIGLWRRTTLDSYREAEPDWEPVLDLDELSKEYDSKMFLEKKVHCNEDPARVLLSLSRGGGRFERMVREFDLHSKAFVTERPFELPPSASGAFREDEAKYAGQVKLWRRGVALKDAPLLYECDKAHSTSVQTFLTGEGTDKARIWISDGINRVRDYYVCTIPRSGDLDAEKISAGLTKVDIPNNAELSFGGDYMAMRLRSDWRQDVGSVLGQGTLVGANLSDFLEGKSKFKTVYEPDDQTSLKEKCLTWADDNAIMTVIERAQERVYSLHPSEGPWVVRPLEGIPGDASYKVKTMGQTDKGSCLLTVRGVFEPPLQLVVKSDGNTECLKQQPARGSPGDYQITYHETKSENGTVPYFEIRKKGSDDGRPRMTLVEYYGGFETFLGIPNQLKENQGWLNDGNVIVYPFVSGDGHYGPARAQIWQKEGNSKANTDVVAVLDDLVDRGVTTYKQIGLTGHSNGGLNVGNMLTDHGDKCGCGIIRNPLTDMKRYVNRSPGVSWATTYYSDPRREEELESALSRSVLHKLKAGVTYKPALTLTATTDRIVHPGHARKLHKRLLELDQNSTFYENRDGGHDTSEVAHRAKVLAMKFAFLRDKLSA